MKTIEFTGSASPYHAGDIAGFEPQVADAYIAADLAKEYKKGKAKDAVSVSPAPTPTPTPAPAP